MFNHIKEDLEKIVKIIRDKGQEYVNVSLSINPFSGNHIYVAHSTRYADASKSAFFHFEGGDWHAAMDKAYAYAEGLKSGDDLKREQLAKLLSNATQLAKELDMDLLVSSLRDEIQKLSENALEDLRA